MPSSSTSLIRLTLLACIAAALLIMSSKVWSYRPLLAIPDGRASVIETAGLLFLYALFVIWATRSNGPLRRAALLAGTPLGVIGGAIQIAHLTQEHFMDLGAVGNGISGFGLLFCTFVLWGTAGYRTARSTGVVRSSAIAGLWSALVTMSIVVLSGFLLEFYLATPKPEYVVTWGEFKRSGWTDVRAFTIANTLDAAQSHLIIGPILGAIFGGLAGAVTATRGRREATTA